MGERELFAAKLLSPKVDYVFKKLLTWDADILKNLIDSVLRRPNGRRIASIEIKNPKISPEDIEKKFIILDVRAVDDSGREYDIEMQVRKYENYPKRTVYYLCKMYGEQLKAGEDYGELHPVIGIHFLDYAPFPSSEADDFQYRFALRDVRHPDLRLNDDLSVHLFDLPAMERVTRDGRGDDLLEWLRFLNRAQEEGDESMQENYQNPMIHKAYNTLKTLSADEETRELAERREKALKDEAMFLNEAKKSGIEEGRKEGRKEGKWEAIELGLYLKFGDKAMGLMSKVREIDDLGRLDLIMEVLRGANALGSVEKAIGNQKEPMP
jgi:predicted transposase/invertase (TIGR01784 family)